MPEKWKKNRIFHVNTLARWESPRGCLPGGGGSNGRESNRRRTLYLSKWARQYRTGDWTGLIRIAEVGIMVCSEEALEALHLTQIRIETGYAAPIHLPPYRLPKVRHQAVQNEIQQLLRAKTIEPSTSPWAPSIVLVPKRDGSLRLCVDYRHLNRVTKPDPYPMPRVDDLLDRLGQAKYISTLDLTKGYWQVPVHPESRQQTAFITPFGKYQFLTKPFGLVGAPTVLQRLMNTVLADVSSFSTAYLDDVSIFSNSWKDHLVHLDEVLNDWRGLD